MRPEARRKDEGSKKKKRNKNSNISEAEYRERNEARREARLQIKNKTYHFWLPNDVPSDEQLKNFRSILLLP